MNIAKAKEIIKNTVTLYLKKDEFGDYRIPVVRQRPIFLLGAPGIGKTAIMEQVSSELGLALVSYSMTHHTRQSAIGLPFIEKRTYGDETVAVSEYTMSEIIATIYQTMEESGRREGILFLDEINCVSETLSPTMLQFLQYKVFGKHKVPEGWVIVTAGNPPQYNKSVREFDVVTLDRLKVLEVEADYPAWKSYAIDKGLHGAILGFLEMNKDSFYKMELTKEGRSYVTARGWEDLSDILKLYEEEGLEVGSDLIGQYIRSTEITKDFEVYYELYGKYRRIYPIEEILAGNAPDAVYEKVREAAFDERISLLAILTASVREQMSSLLERFGILNQMRLPLKGILEKGDAVEEGLEKLVHGQEERLSFMQKAGTAMPREVKKVKELRQQYLELLYEVQNELRPQEEKNPAMAAEILRGAFNRLPAKLNVQVAGEKERLHELFSFTQKAFGEESNELLILTTELTAGSVSAEFISRFGLEDYEKYAQLLLAQERTEKLREEIAAGLATVEEL